MRVEGVLVLVASAACGRIGYDDYVPDAQGDGASTTIDAPRGIDRSVSSDAHHSTDGSRDDAPQPRDATKPVDAVHPKDTGRDAGTPDTGHIDAPRDALHDVAPRDVQADTTEHDAVAHDAMGRDAISRDAGKPADAHHDGVVPPKEGGTISLDGGLVLSTYPVAPSSKPWGMTLGPDGRIWFTATSADGKGEIGAFSPSTPTSVTYYSANLPDKAMPWGIVSGPDQNLWFTDPGTNQIGRITTGGSISEYTGVTAGGQPWTISQTATTAPGLMFTELAGNRLGFIGVGGTGITAISEVLLNTESGASPWGIGLYTSGGDQSTQVPCFTASAGGNVGCFADGTGSPPTLYATGAAGAMTTPAPFGMTQGPNGALWIADNTQSVIATFTPAGTGAGGTTLQTYATPTANAGPYVITPGASVGGVEEPGSVTGTVWFTEYTAGQIGRVNLLYEATPTITEFPAGNGSAPAGIVVQSDGTVWFAAYGGNFIGSLQPGAEPE